MTPRVFISSRIRELELERVVIEEAVKELLNNEDILYKTWRWETASKEIPHGDSPDKVQSGELKKSDVYLLILGVEYGPEEGISSTHKEYDEALFEFDNDYILVYVKNDENTVKKREERLKKWLERIASEVTYKGFKSTEELKAHVKDKLRALWHDKFKEKGEGFEKIGIPEKFKGENVLGREGASEPKIFREQGPLWIDFQRGMVDTGAFQVLLTKQGKELRFDDLFINHHVILLAPPASGKSVLLRYICYELCTRKKSVYLVE